MEFRVRGLRFMVWMGLGCRVQVLGLKVYGSGWFRVYGSGFKISEDIPGLVGVF